MAAGPAAGPRWMTCCLLALLAPGCSAQGVLQLELVARARISAGSCRSALRQITARRLPSRTLPLPHRAAWPPPQPGWPWCAPTGDACPRRRGARVTRLYEAARVPQRCWCGTRGVLHWRACGVLCVAGMTCAGMRVAGAGLTHHVWAPVVRTAGVVHSAVPNGRRRRGHRQAGYRRGPHRHGQRQRDHNVRRLHVPHGVGADRLRQHHLLSWGRRQQAVRAGLQSRVSGLAQGQQQRVVGRPDPAVAVSEHLPGLP